MKRFITLSLFFPLLLGRNKFTDELFMVADQFPDWVLHSALFTILTSLFIKLNINIKYLLVFAILTEFIQPIVGRAFQIHDMVVNILAIGFVYYSMKYTSKKLKPCLSK